MIISRCARISLLSLLLAVSCLPLGFGQGVADADYDGNGLLDIFKTNFAADTNTLYHNAGEWAFTDQTVLSGLAVVTRYVGWGAAFLDFDHDGRQDIFTGNGHVSPSVDGTPINENFRQPRLLFWRRDRTGKRESFLPARRSEQVERAEEPRPGAPERFAPKQPSGSSWRTLLHQAAAGNSGGERSRG